MKKTIDSLSVSHIHLAEIKFDHNANETIYILIINPVVNTFLDTRYHVPNNMETSLIDSGNCKNRHLLQYVWFKQLTPIWSQIAVTVHISTAATHNNLFEHELLCQCLILCFENVVGQSRMYNMVAMHSLRGIII